MNFQLALFRAFSNPNAFNRLLRHFLFSLPLIFSLAKTGTADSYIPGLWNTLHTASTPRYNPAFLVNPQQSSFSTYLNAALPSDFFGWEHLFVAPVGLYSGMQFSYMDLITLDEHRNVYPFEQYRMFSAAYGFHLFSSVNGGVTGYFINDLDDGKSFTQQAADIGLSLTLANHEYLGQHDIGILFQNALSFGTSRSSLPLPLTVGATWNYVFAEGVFKGSITGNLKNIYYRKENSSDKKSLRLTYNTRNTINLSKSFLRFGAGTEFWSLGGGIRHYLKNGNRISGGIELLHFRDQTPATGVSFSGEYEFGKTREAVYARKMGTTTCCDFHHEFFIRMIKLHYEQKYYDSFFIGAQMLYEYPEEIQNTQVLFYLIATAKKLYWNDMVTYFLEHGETLLSEIRIGRNKAIHSSINMFGLKSFFKLSDSIPYKIHLRNSGKHTIAHTYLLNNNYRDAIKWYGSIDTTYGEFNNTRLEYALALYAYGKKVEALKLVAKYSSASQDSALSETALLSILLFAELTMADTSKTVPPPIFETVEQVSPINRYYFDTKYVLQLAAFNKKRFDECIKIGTDILSNSENTQLQLYSKLLMIKSSCRINNALSLKKELESFKQHVSKVTVNKTLYPSKRDSLIALALQQNQDIQKGIKECMFARRIDSIMRKIDSLITEHELIHPTLQSLSMDPVEPLRQQIDFYNLEQLSALINKDLSVDEPALKPR